jgi:hypothetical protein
MNDFPSPYDSAIKRAIDMGARAVVMLRDRYGTPGQSMYYVTGKSQDHLTVPVVEIYQKSKQPSALMNAIPPRGIPVQIWPMKNEWKAANDVTSFQITWNVILSMFEVAVICISILRLHEWFRVPGITVFSIGPLCIILELLGSLIRLALTIVDPFFSLRILPSQAGMVLTTGSLPFVFASGILLTFFWAESLSVHRIQATPFIAEYKKSAVFVVCVLFIGEIVTSTVRTTIRGGGQFNPVYLTQGFYVIVAVVLIVCYLICAYKITQRMKSFHHGKKNFVRDMSIRFALSSAGYILFVITMVASIPLLTQPWPFKVVVNVICLSANVAAVLQVYSLRPPQERSFSSTVQREGMNEETGEGGLSTMTSGDRGKSSTSHYANSTSRGSAHSSSSNDFKLPYSDEESQMQEQLGDSTASDSLSDDSASEMEPLTARVHKEDGGHSREDD